MMRVRCPCLASAFKKLSLSLLTLLSLSFSHTHTCRQSIQAAAMATRLHPPRVYPTGLVRQTHTHTYGEIHTRESRL